VDQSLIKGVAEEALIDSAAVVEARFSISGFTWLLWSQRRRGYWEDEDKARLPIVIIGRAFNIHHHLISPRRTWLENMKYIEPTPAPVRNQARCNVRGMPAAAIHLGDRSAISPSLAESILMTSKRHPYEMNVRLGANAKGMLSAYCNDILIDKGAYRSADVYPRSLMTLSGSYNIPNVSARIRLAYTNNPWEYGPGAGQPQVAFALECAMDMLADKLG